MLLKDTPAVLSLGYNYSWTSGQKPHLKRNGRRIRCNTANYVPFVVLGQSTSSSSSSSPTSPTSSSQEAVTPTQHPASTRSEGMSEEVRGESSRRPAETENPIKMKTTKEYGATRCVICQNGKKSSREILLVLVSQNIETPPVLLMNHLQSREQKWYRVSIVFSVTSRDICLRLLQPPRGNAT